MSSGPSRTPTKAGARVMKATSSAKKGFACVLVVVAPGRRLVDPAQLARHEAQAPALEAGQDLADEPALDAVGLHDDEGALHGARRYHRPLSPDAARARGGAPRTAPTT